MDFKTPGSYVQEVSLLPNSVVQVETAIPAFVGYTQKGDLKPYRVSSFMDFEAIYGDSDSYKCKNKNKTSLVTFANQELVLPSNGQFPKFKMYHALQMYFANGGGACYIVSVGNYDSAEVDFEELKSGLDLLTKEDEPTLIVFPDATSLVEGKMIELYNQALQQAESLKDRFVLIDTYTDKSEAVDNLRQGLSLGGALKYGAAYYPHLLTTLKYTLDDSNIYIRTTINREQNRLLRRAREEAEELKNAAQIARDEAEVALLADPGNTTLEAAFEVSKVLFANATDTLEVAVKEEETNRKIQLFVNDILLLESKSISEIEGYSNSKNAITLSGIKNLNISIYNSIKKSIVTKLGGIVLAPSSIMAGIYAKVDSTVGVWKAPANIGVNAVVKPTVKITNDIQDGLNVDVIAGKSINAIRTFTGKGTLVWGARTLDGNSSEWRYVPVRRLFNMVEESVKKASERFVFESNNSKTWVQIRAMIENFLNQQWVDGALAGNTAEEAFYVRVGLGETMTSVDILEGRMNIEIGMAAARPAEFIVLKFSHKLQEE